MNHTKGFLSSHPVITTTMVVLLILATSVAVSHKTAMLLSIMIVATISGVTAFRSHFFTPDLQGLLCIWMDEFDALLQYNASAESKGLPKKDITSHLTSIQKIFARVRHNRYCHLTYALQQRIESTLAQEISHFLLARDAFHSRDLHHTHAYLKGWLEFGQQVDLYCDTQVFTKIVMLVAQYYVQHPAEEWQFGERFAIAVRQVSKNFQEVGECACISDMVYLSKIDRHATLEDKIKCFYENRRHLSDDKTMASIALAELLKPIQGLDDEDISLRIMVLVEIYWASMPSFNKIAILRQGLAGDFGKKPIEYMYVLFGTLSYSMQMDVMVYLSDKIIIPPVLYQIQDTSTSLNKRVWNIMGILYKER